MRQLTYEEDQLLRSKNYECQWYATLDKSNAAAFVTRLKVLLEGKMFTFISVNDHLGTRPNVRINQCLEGRSVRPGDNNRPPSRETYPAGSAANIGLSFSDDPDLPDYIHILVCDTYGIWSVGNGAYFVFNPGGRWEPNCVTINFKAGAGNDITWTIYPTGDIPADYRGK
jgi:hypothetical protein